MRSQHQHRPRDYALHLHRPDFVRPGQTPDDQNQEHGQRREHQDGVQEVECAGGLQPAGEQDQRVRREPVAEEDDRG